jgi:hypothetical protein
MAAGYSSYFLTPQNHSRCLARIPDVSLVLSIGFAFAIPQGKKGGKRENEFGTSGRANKRLMPVIERPFARYT